MRKKFANAWWWWRISRAADWEEDVDHPHSPDVQQSRQHQYDIGELGTSDTTNTLHHVCRYRCINVCILCHGLQVLVVPQPSFPSIDDQIKRSLKPFDMLYILGIARTIIEETINRTLREDHAKHATNDSIVFNESHHPKYYLKKDNINLPERILNVVMNDSLFLGTNESQMEMKSEIKRDFNNGTLTDAEVDNILQKILNILREKTQDELKKYIDDHVNKDFNDIMRHFDNFYRIGAVRDILKKTIKKIFKEDHAKHATNDTIVFNENQYANYLNQNNNIRQRVLDAAMKDPLMLGTDESKLEMKNEIKNLKRDFKNKTFTDVEVDNILQTLLDTMQQKTKNELKKYVDELVVNNTINNKITKKEKQYTIH
uniref:Uncharacterized protein n=1 Tax=Cacopsylla melanoneura TaxID=428564 RepID=A0A8D8S5C3_9HEMI